MGRTIPAEYIVFAVGSLGASGMINSKNLVAVLRRDVSFVWHAVIAIVFIGFAGLAVAAALLDLWALRN